ncbi:MAG: right-handed parallel beta-helix repeat-containing protein [Pyrinomonadaceae bacterium]|nr:right-handed parallel beta-helix repeat-containing protein [Pyrinomonadaceae bacterium]
MTKVHSTFRGAFCALALLACSMAYASSAQAQGVLRFVASTGNDANNCLRTTPCRSINRGVESAPSGSELIILDTAGYGPTVTIDKSITITAPSGVAATIATPSGISITITNGDVVLRGLVLIGQGTGTDGIAFQAGSSLSVENCIINGFTNAGINATSAGAALFVKDTTIRNGGLDGIFVSGLFATIYNCRLERNGTLSSGFGIFAFNNARVTVSNTVAANNGSGFVAEADLGSGAQLNAENCVAANNTADGFRVAGAGTSIIRVSNSAATNNANGFRQTTGTFESRGNNTVRGNTSNTVGLITPITPV